MWPKEIGADYLIVRTGREAERNAAEVLSLALGGLPLAHEQAAAYCERLDVSLADYRKRFKTAPSRLLDDARHAPAEYHDGLTVAKTFALAIEEAAKLHPAAEPLIIHAALLAPEPIPLFLFAEAHEKFGEPLALMLADHGLDEAMAALRALALVDRETIVDERDASIAADAIRLHRLVREVAAVRCEGESRDQSWRALVAALSAVYPSDGIGNPTSWPRCASLTPHLLSVCETEMVNAAASAECADLLNRAGEYFYYRGAYLEARPLYERALAIREKVLGPEHPDTATSLNSLASLLQAQGDLAGSRPLYERALAIREKVFGPEHRYMALSLNSLASLLQDQGDLAGSRPLYERALAICEKVFGPEHPYMALNLNSLGDLLYAEGDLAGSRRLVERALAIRETVLGPEHPDTAMSLCNLAYVLQAQGDLAAARPLVERALAIDEKVLGPEHVNTATDLSNMARLLSKSGHTDDAEPLFKRAIAIKEKALGLGHPQTQRHCSHYARHCLDTGRATEALWLGQVALAAHEMAPGPNHPWTKDSARVTADALDAQGNTDEAAELRARYGIDGP